MSVYPMAEKQEIIQPEQLRFTDDGIYPGSVLPLLLYRAAIIAEAHDRAAVLERGFAQNDWRNSWRNGVYSFAHYHSTSHEVLGVYDGFAKLRLGGEHGQTVEIRSGDVILIPAGVAHQNIGASPDFGVVGAYPDGRHWDLLRGLPGERPKSDYTIAALPIPDCDPIYGAKGPLRQIWNGNGARSK
ncbi:MAG: cupin [Candidatus Udaeobacter sp.]